MLGWLCLLTSSLFVPTLWETNNQDVKTIYKTDDSGNAMFQSYLSKLFKKETG